MAKRLLALLLIGLCLLGPARAGQEKETLTLRVFLYDACGGCASADYTCRECAVVTQVHDRLTARLKPLVDSGQVRVLVRNLFFENVRSEQASYLKAFGLLEGERAPLPQYLVGEPGWGQALYGEEREEELPGVIARVLETMPMDAAWRRPPREGQQLLTPRSDPLDDIQLSDSLIVYFYKDFCPYCLELSPLFDALPEQVTLPDGSLSRVRFVSLEKQIPRQMAAVQRYYDKLIVHPDRQYVPMVVIGQRALFLKEEIVAYLLKDLLAGEGLKTDRAPLVSLWNHEKGERTP